MLSSTVPLSVSLKYTLAAFLASASLAAAPSLFNLVSTTASSSSSFALVSIFLSSLAAVVLVFISSFIFLACASGLNIYAP